MRRSLITVVGGALAIGFAGCIIIHRTVTLPPPPYQASAPLSSDVVHSPDGDMIATIAQGWMLMNLGTKLDENSVLVMCDTSYSGILFFHREPLTQSLAADIQQQGMEPAARKSFQRIKAKIPGALLVTKEYQVFGVNDREFCSYEYTSDQYHSINRVVVFSTGKRIYECVAAQYSSDDKPMMKFADLCAAQQSVVESVRW
jgi:hypothetical protein